MKLEERLMHLGIFKFKRINENALEAVSIQNL
jgi:hypothetical protein